MKNRFRIGPGAASLVLMVVVVTMCVMEMLTLISARNDDRLTSRSLAVAENYYAMSAAAERTRAELDALAAQAAAGSDSEEAWLEAMKTLLPEKTEMDGDVIRWIEEGDGRRLICAVYVNGRNASPRLRWLDHYTVSETENGEDGEEEKQRILAVAAEQAQADLDLISDTVARLAETVKDRKQLEKALAEALPEGFSVQDGSVNWSVRNEESVVLVCEAVLQENNETVPVRLIRCERTPEWQ